jgi:hypothetical protein
MATFWCKTCGSFWSEGPMSNHVNDQDCRHCMTSNFDNLRSQLDDLAFYLEHSSWRCNYYRECHCGLNDLCDKMGIPRIPFDYGETPPE